MTFFHFDCKVACGVVVANDFEEAKTKVAIQFGVPLENISVYGTSFIFVVEKKQEM